MTSFNTPNLERTTLEIANDVIRDRITYEQAGKMAYDLFVGLGKFDLKVIDKENASLTDLLCALIMLRDSAEEQGMYDKESVKEWLLDYYNEKMDDLDIMNHISDEKESSYMVVRPRLSPDFDLPSRKRLLKLKKGDSVKLMFQVGQDDVERMWVTLSDTTEIDAWKGTVDNEALQLSTRSILAAGREVEFHPLDIISIY
jgi:hypothetical protein